MYGLYIRTTSCVCPVRRFGATIVSSHPQTWTRLMESHFLCDLCRKRDLEMSDELVGGSHDLTVAARDMAANLDPSTSSIVQPIGTTCSAQ